MGNVTEQVYWADDYTGAVRCVSVAGDGAQGNSPSYNPRIGGAAGDEGSYIAFESIASNLFSPKIPGGQHR
jgi:hypothetical protein